MNIRFNRYVRDAGKVFDHILDGLAILACAVCAFIMILISFDTVQRYCWHKAMLWTIPLSEFSLVIMTACGAAWLLKEEGHINLDFVLGRLKPKAQNCVTSVTSVLSALALLPVLWHGGKLTISYFERGVIEYGVPVPKAYMLLAIIIGLFLFFIQFVRRGYTCLKKALQKG